MQRWYVLCSKTNKEKFLCGQLESCNIEYYCPFVKVKVVNPRSRTILPYFPGYLFIHVDIAQVGLSAISWLPGSYGLLHFDSDPLDVPDQVFMEIKHRIDSLNKIDSAPKESFLHGSHVVIEKGPFAGYEAIFDTCLSGGERVRVLISMLKNQQVPLVLPMAQLQHAQLA